MKILHILDHSLPQQTGYVYRTLGLLRAERAAGWANLALTSPKHQESIGADALDAEFLGIRFFRSTRVTARLPLWRERLQMQATYDRLCQLIETERPDVLHAHSPVLNAFPALKAGRRYGLPVVYQIRAFWEDAAVDHGTTTEGSLRYRATARAEEMACARADALVTICQGLRDDLARRGLDMTKTTIVPNAVDIEQFPLLNPADRNLALADRLGLRPQDRVIGFIGSFYAYEGLDLLIAALAHLPADVRLLLIGGGPEEQRLRGLAAPWAERVIFGGRIPHDQVRGAYALLDVLAYPRKSMRLTELVTPLKPLEALAMGLPVVASDVGGHRELLRDGHTGWLFPAGNPQALATAIMICLGDPAERARRRLLGRAFVESERHWGQTAQIMAPVYARLVDYSKSQKSLV